MCGMQSCSFNMDKQKMWYFTTFQTVDKVRHTRAGFFFCGLIGRFLEIYQLISVIIEVS